MKKYLIFMLNLLTISTAIFINCEESIRNQEKSNKISIDRIINFPSPNWKDIQNITIEKSEPLEPHWKNRTPFHLEKRSLLSEEVVELISIWQI